MPYCEGGSRSDEVAFKRNAILILFSLLFRVGSATWSDNVTRKHTEKFRSGIGKYQTDNTYDSPFVTVMCSICPDLSRMKLVFKVFDFVIS